LYQGRYKLQKIVKEESLHKLQLAKTALLIIDVQGKLAYQVDQSSQILGNLQKLIKSAWLYELPIIVVEQCPWGLGHTVPEISHHLQGIAPVEKNTFNACLNEAFVARLKQSGKKQLLVAGIEAHVCVYQTVSGLLDQAYQVHLVSDAVSSRTAWNRETALNRMRELGAVITSTEMALFELVKVAEGERFRQFIQIVK